MKQKTALIGLKVTLRHTTAYHTSVCVQYASVCTYGGETLTYAGGTLGIGSIRFKHGRIRWHTARQIFF